MVAVKKRGREWRPRWEGSRESEEDVGKAGRRREIGSLRGCQNSKKRQREGQNEGEREDRELKGSVMMVRKDSGGKEEGSEFKEDGRGRRVE